MMGFAFLRTENLWEGRAMSAFWAGHDMNICNHFWRGRYFLQVAGCRLNLIITGKPLALKKKGKAIELSWLLHDPVYDRSVRWLPCKCLTGRSDGRHAVRDSASPNPKMHQKRKTIEIEMYCGSKYNKTAGTWSLTLVRLVNFIIFSGKGKSWIKFCTWFNLLQALFNIYVQNDPCKVEPSTGKT